MQTRASKAQTSALGKRNNGGAEQGRDAKRQREHNGGIAGSDFRTVDTRDHHRVQKHRDLTLSRIDNFRSDRELLNKLYSDAVKLNASVWKAPGRVLFKDMLQQAEFTDAKHGMKLSPIWSTYWLKIDIAVPADTKYHGKELHLLLDFGGEALVYDENGHPLQGLNGQTGEDRRIDWCVFKQSTKGGSMLVYIELANNQLFGNSDWKVGPTNAVESKEYSLKQLELAIFHRDVWALLMDTTVIVDVAKHTDEERAQSYRAMLTANSIVNAVDLDDPTTYPKGQQIAMDEFFSQPYPAPFHLSATGHCHIDTAWLWPYAETRRKCARSWATQISLMKRYPKYRFACSQAQQYAWLKEDYPTLFEEIKEFARKGQFIPVGGTWVEMDCNIPSGESLVRQFVYGQRFFMKEFDRHCETFWLPDTFGYAAQMPQIMKLARMKYFLTQKLSWNQFNKMPNNTFLWEGLDGSRVLTHFPPADNYCSHATVSDVLKSETNCKDRGRVDEAMLLFGHGDGGGGPNPKMIEMLGRMQQGAGGIPRVTFDSPDDFFARAERNAHRLNVWSGELYFEYHRATYTTQAKTKLNNRRCEILLHDVEFLCSIATFSSQNLYEQAYPREQLDKCWKLLLLNQFHDVIPGTSITEVYVDSNRHYDEIMDILQSLIDRAMSTLRACSGCLPHQHFLINTLPFERYEVVQLRDFGVLDTKQEEEFSYRSTTSLSESSGAIAFGDFGLDTETPAATNEKDKQTTNLHLVKVPAMGQLRGTLENIKDKCSVDVSSDVVSVEHDQPNRKFILKNNSVTVTIDQTTGHVVSVIHNETGRESIAIATTPNDTVPSATLGGNHFVLFDDRPLYWDAWDTDCYHLEKRREISEVESICIHEDNNARCSVRLSFKISEASTLQQIISLQTHSPVVEFHTKVDWHESHKFLKVEFPLTIHAPVATYEIPFGAVQRPTHMNTQWDMAKFECCAQTWADVGEYGFGVSLLNNCKYGYSVHRNVMTLSLLRAPEFPDPTADIGAHEFAYALYPHTGSWQEAGVVQRALQLNRPLHISLALQAGSETERLEDLDRNRGCSPIHTTSFFSVENNRTGSGHAMLDTVKMPDDSDAGSSVFVLRLYEAYGGRTTTTVTCVRPIARVEVCNVLEELVEEEVGTVSLCPPKTNNNAMDVDDEDDDEEEQTDMMANVCRSISISFKPFEIKTVRIFIL